MMETREICENCQTLNQCEACQHCTECEQRSFTKVKEDGFYDMEYVWRWIERLVFDKKLSTNECISVLKHMPHAPWNDPDIEWDTSHLPYHDEIQKLSNKKT